LKPILGKSASKASQKPAFSSNTLRITNNTVQEGFKRNITLAAKKYTFSFFMDKGLEDLNDKEYFSVDILNSTNAIVYTFTTKVNATGYYNFDYSATTAGTYTWRFRRVSLNGRSSSGTAYFDDFKVSYNTQQSQQVCSSPKNYRFGFNTQEKDDEVYGAGNLNAAEFWEYDTRLGRRWNKDPKYTAFESRYSVNGNNPNYFSDPLGDYKTKLGARLANLFKKGEVKQATEGAREGQWYFTKGQQNAKGKVNTDGSVEMVVTASRPDFGDKKASTSENKSILANTYIEFNAGFAFGGGIGFAIGKVYDNQGNSNWYGSFSGNLGLYAGAGFNEGKIIPTNSSHKFVNSDFEGEGKSYSAGYGIFGGSYGGSWLEGSERKDHPEDQFNPARFGLNNTNTQTGGYTTLSGGLSKGPGLKIGGAYSHTKTWLFND
jgi:hypothetical protein